MKSTAKQLQKNEVNSKNIYQINSASPKQKAICTNLHKFYYKSWDNNKFNNESSMEQIGAQIVVNTNLRGGRSEVLSELGLKGTQ